MIAPEAKREKANLDVWSLSICLPRCLSKTQMSLCFEREKCNAIQMINIEIVL